jgi:proteasome lid subunit RPN8/RPN11
MKNRNNSQKNQKPMLRFSPTAWAKLLFMRDVTDNEIGGFGITEADDLLFVTDFAMVKQKVSGVSVAFADESVADFFEDQVTAGRKPEQFARIWLHTHPGNSPEPSTIDEATFTRVFGSCDWSVMCIVAQDGGTFARLRFNVGPSGEVKIPVYVDYGCEFDAANFELWKQQYKANVIEDEIFKQTDKPIQPATNQQKEVELFGNENFNKVPLFSSEDLLSEIDRMEPIEREMFMEELAIKSDFWDEGSEVFYG